MENKTKMESVRVVEEVQEVTGAGWCRILPAHFLCLFWVCLAALLPSLALCAAVTCLLPPKTPTEAWW